MIKFCFRLILLGIILSSCSPIMGIYGIRSPKEIDKNKIIKISERFDIPKEDFFELDTSYFSFLSSLLLMSNDSLMHDSLKIIEFKNQVKNHSQPLQALYFDKSGKLVSFQINCYAGGFPNLKWERDSILTTFPPKLQAPLDSILSSSLLSSFLHPIANHHEIIFNDNEYIVYVFWSRFMGRQNKRFINFIQENFEISKEKNIKIIYINIDNAFVKSNLW